MRGTAEHVGEVMHAGPDSRMRHKRRSRPCAGDGSPHFWVRAIAASLTSLLTEVQCYETADGDLALVVGMATLAFAVAVAINQFPRGRFFWAVC